MTEQDVTRDQFVFEQEVARANASAQKDRNIEITRAQAQQEADTFAAEQARLAGIAVVKRDESVQVAEVEKTRALEVANQQRERAARVAEIEKQRTVEIATRENAIAIAAKEQERAESEAKRYAAEAQMEAERQAVRTVEITQTAEREKSKAIIDAQAEFERRRLAEQVQADVAAYAVVKSAEGAAAAADKDAAARRTLAEAAEGGHATRGRRPTARRRWCRSTSSASASRSSRRASAWSGRSWRTRPSSRSISRGLQVDLAKIDAEKQVRIAAAQAFGDAMASAKMTVWGDPDTVQRMSESFFKGQQFGYLADGLITNMPDGRQGSPRTSRRDGAADGRAVDRPPTAMPRSSPAGRARRRQ